jgi:hypothetical protein
MILASQDPRMSKQGTASKRKHTTLMVPQKLKIVSRLESGKN